MINHISWYDLLRHCSYMSVSLQKNEAVSNLYLLTSQFFSSFFSWRLLMNPFFSIELKKIISFATENQQPVFATKFWKDLAHRFYEWKLATTTKTLSWTQDNCNNSLKHQGIRFQGILKLGFGSEAGLSHWREKKFFKGMTILGFVEQVIITQRRKP